MVKKKEKIIGKKEEVVEKRDRPCIRLFKKTTRVQWAIFSLVLFLVIVVGVVVNMTSGISSKEAEEITNTFLVEQYGLSSEDIEFVSTSLKDEIYFINFTVQGQKGSFAVSKDGKYFGQMIEAVSFLHTNQNEIPASTEVPKSDRPKVELYIWGYCPYGVQAQGPMAEVASLLGNSADFTIVPYYAGHGSYEAQQNKIQSCIQKLSPDKYWSYASGFVSNIYTKCGAKGDIDCDKNESVMLMNSLGIDSTSVLACVESEGTELNSVASQKAQARGVTGSPTITINGVIVNVARNADAIKNAVCSAYNNVPAECEEILDSSASAAAGSC